MDCQFSLHNGAVIVFNNMFVETGKCYELSNGFEMWDKKFILREISALEISTSIHFRRFVWNKKKMDL